MDTGGDVAVVAIETTRNQQTLNTFYDDFGESTTTTETYKVGTLVVDLLDAATKHLIWRGCAAGNA